MNMGMGAMNMGAMAGMGTMFPTTTPGVPTMMFPRVNDFFGASAVSPLSPSHTSSVPVADLSQDLCGSLNQNNIFK